MHVSNKTAEAVDEKFDFVAPGLNLRLWEKQANKNRFNDFIVSHYID